jgi:Ca2+-dependent lipid-binding protein
MDDNGLSDPYVIVQVGTKKTKTKVIRESLNPSWKIGPKGEVFNFN